jgi:20S proteasome subunit alpha 5
VLGIEKKLPSSKLMEVSNKSEKLVEIDRHCVCAMSGIVGDARILIDHARVEAQNHNFNFNEQMGVEAITQAVSDLAINFGEGYEGSKRKPMARPYGVALLIGGVDENGPQLFQTDPSGTYCEWQADAIGSGQETAMSSLKESYHSNMSLAEAEKMVLQVLKGNMEEKITKENVEIMVVRTSTRQWERRTAAEMETMIATLA